MYHFPWNPSGPGPDLVLLPEFSCMQPNPETSTECSEWRDSNLNQLITTLFDTVIETKGHPLFAFATLNDAHGEDSSRLQRAENVIIESIKRLVQSQWMKAGNVFILSADHGLHFWNSKSTDNQTRTGFVAEDAERVSSHRNPPLFLVSDSKTGVAVDEMNADAIITHYDVHRTICDLMGIDSRSDRTRLNVLNLTKNIYSDRIENRTCADIGFGGYCNCWRPCQMNGHGTVDFSAKLQALKPCVV
jgi:hypothetical protein